MNSAYLFNENAEKSVVAAFIHGDVKDFESFMPDDFFFDDVREIFNAAKLLHSDSRPCDAVSVSDLLSSKAALELLIFLKSSYYGPSSYKEHKKIVKKLSYLRKLYQLAEDIKEKVCNDGIPEEVSVFAEGELKKLQSTTQTRECSSLSELMPMFYDHLVLKSERGTIPGISTGFPELDKMTGGLIPGNLYIVGARPAMGKSAFASSLAINAAKKGKPCLFFSLEMGSELVVQRMLSHELEISNSNLKLGNLSIYEWDRLSDEGLNSFSKLPLYIDDRSGLNSDNITFSSMRLNNELMKKEKKLSLIVVDYLQIMTGKDKDRRQVVEDNCRKLKILARRLKCPVILLSQLNRGTESGQDKRPSLVHLRESGAIEQDADTVFLLYRDEYYEKENKNNSTQRCEVIIAKQRDGALGTVKIDFHPKYTKFTEQGFVILEDNRTWEQITAE